MSYQLFQSFLNFPTNASFSRFRWVYCQLDLLSRLRTPGAVRNALKSLPPTLDETYKALLSRIDGEEDKKLSRDILELLAFSLYPLTLSEICEYLQITPGMFILDESKRLTDSKDVLSICGSLLNISGGFGQVSLAHHSVKSYLMSDIKGDASYFQLSAPKAHRTIAIRCLAYLSLEEFSSGPCEKQSGIDERHQRFPFLKYATLKWAVHTEKLEELGDSLWDILKAFLFSGDAGRGNFHSWVQLLIPGSRNIARTPPLYYAASFGLTTVVRYLLEAGADTEVHGGRTGATPLNIACFRGHEHVVKILLEYGADPHAIDEDLMSGIQWARLNRYWKVLDMIEGSGSNAASSELSRLKQDHLPSLSVFHVMEVVKVQLKPEWDQSETKRRLWWVLVGLAEEKNNHPVGVSIHLAALSRLGGSEGTKIPGTTWALDTATSGVERNGFSRIVEPWGQPWGPAPLKRYSVLVGTRSFLSFNRVNVDGDLYGDLTTVVDHENRTDPLKATTRIHTAIDGVYAGVLSLTFSSPVVAKG